MGYVHKPVPLEVWAKLTPEQRKALYLSERAFLVRQRASGASDLSLMIGILAACAIIALILCAMAV
jgi:hypothetical protein